MTRFGPSDIPVVIGNGAVLRDPSIEAVAKRLGLDEIADAAQVRDLVVVGAGPAGLAAAVYGSATNCRSLRAGALQLPDSILGKLWLRSP